MSTSHRVAFLGMFSFCVSCVVQGTANTADDHFSSRLRKSCASDETYDQCDQLEGALAAKSFTCEKDVTHAETGCDGVHEELRATRARFAVLKRDRQERADAEFAKENEARQQQQDANDHARARAVAKENAIQKWMFSVEDRCSAEMSARVCDDAPDGVADADKTKCSDDCAREIDGALAQRFNGALSACLSGYVKANGRGKSVCSVVLPATADLKGDAFSGRVDECTKKCTNGGPAALAEARERTNAEQQGPALVVGYKKCMVAADSTPAARKYEAYERDLYAALMEKANATCRKSFRCDWLESKTDRFVCEWSPP